MPKERRNFEDRLNKIEAAAWIFFRNGCNNFLENVKAENYIDLVNELLLSYKTLGGNMFLKIHFLHSHLVSDANGEWFHQDDVVNTQKICIIFKLKF